MTEEIVTSSDHKPGEVSAEIGRAYSFVFTGALQTAISDFRVAFRVEESPEKLSFKTNAGEKYSFDFSGHLPGLEVLGECKGYSVGDSLNDEYRRFIAKAYATSHYYHAHRRDLFWFVTNVPFLCSAGRSMTSVGYVRQTLSSKDSYVQELIGRPELDDEFIIDLAQRIHVFILTDTYLKNIPITYNVQTGDSIWKIVQLLHGGIVPGGAFMPLANRVAHMNALENPDKIRSGSQIVLPWVGVGWDG